MTGRRIAVIGGGISGDQPERLLDVLLARCDGQQPKKVIEDAPVLPYLVGGRAVPFVESDP
ncbi:MAG TPA: hypothetical protein VG123_01125 [Streptosporangiaceae bacterium]|nr:hypothetical protein [Streptosporangiaceae bacterium]